MKTNSKINWKVIALVLITLGLIVVSTQANGRALADSDNPCQPRQWCVDPDEAQEIPPGDTITFGVGFGDFSDDSTDDDASTQAAPPGVYGAEFVLSFNWNVVQVEDANPEKEGVQIEVGPLFPSQDGDFAVGKNIVIPPAITPGAVNPDAQPRGQIQFGIALVDPAAPITIGGIMARFELRGINPGAAGLKFETVKLSDKDGFPIDYQGPTDPDLTVTTSKISGKVLLQGRTDHSGTQVALSADACATTVVIKNILDPVAETVTATDGSFEFTNLSGSFKCLNAFKGGYLIGQKSLPAGNLGTITLPGGDVTQDDLIDIFDLAFIGARYLRNDAEADVNGDGLVDIFDLTMAAGNYDKKGPVTNWQ